MARPQGGLTGNYESKDRGLRHTCVDKYSTFIYHLDVGLYEQPHVGDHLEDGVGG